MTQRTRPPHPVSPEIAAKRSAVRAPLAPAAIAVALALLALEGASVRDASAGPTGEQLIAGSATVDRSGSQTIINQTSNRAALNWQSFSIGSAESVIFQQPGASSVALNRVVGPDPSAIYGTLRANGQVFLINPGGVLFGRGANVDVAGLVASTLNIGTHDFMAGRYVFSGGQGSGSVVNHADITVPKGSYVALLGNQVTNTGTIVASNGSAALGAGESMVLDFNGDGLLNLKVNAAAANARIDHGGQIHVDGGAVIMSAQAKNALLNTVLNVDGIVTAKGVVERGGHIYLDGGRSGVTSVTGKLDASSAAAKGGEIRVLGENVGLFGHAKLDASGASGGGTVLVGGDFQGRNPDVPNARRTSVGPDATIVADAIATGDGGRIIVWADDVTKFAGSVSARGGADHGNGGFAEVSGARSLVFTGKADLSAPHGATGRLLLDPDVVVIQGGSGPSAGSGDVDGFDDPGTTVTITEATLESLGANVTLQAKNGIVVAGAFGVNSNGEGTGAIVRMQNNVSLTLETRNAVGEGTMGINLVDGAVAAPEFQTQGAGSFAIRAGTTGVGAGGAGATPIKLGKLTALGTGSIDVAANGAVTLTDALATRGGGAVTVEGVGISSTAAGSITTTTAPDSGIRSGDVTLDAKTGAIDLQGAIVTAGSASTSTLGADGGDVTLIADGPIAVAAINVSGGPTTSAADDGGFAGFIDFQTFAPLTLRGNVTARGGSAVDGVGGDGTDVLLPQKVLLGGDVTIDSRGGATSVNGVPGSSGGILFFDTIESPGTPRALTTRTDNFVAFAGDVGQNGNPLLALTIDGTDAGGNIAGVVGLGSRITTTTTQTYNSQVLLFDNTVLTSSGVGANGNITFGSTIDSPLGPLDLTINTAGTTTFGGTVGDFGATSLNSLSVLGGGPTIIRGDAIDTDGSQTYSGPVVLGNDVELVACGCVPGSMTFGSTINGDGVAERSLFIDVGQGTVFFGGSIGNTQALSALAVGAPAITFNSATPQVLNVTGDGGNPFAVTLAGPGGPFSGFPTQITLAQDLSVNAGTGGVFFFGPIDGPHALVARSEIVIGFLDSVGAGTRLKSLRTEGAGAAFLGLGGGPIVVNTSEAQTYNTDVVVFDNIVFSSLGSGANGDITFSRVLEVAGTDVTVNTAGTTTFGGAVGGNGGVLGTLTTDAPGRTVIAGGSVTTDGAQTYGDAVTLGANTTLGSLSSGAIAFGSTIDGAFALNVNTTGATTFGGMVGGASALASLTTDADGGTTVTSDITAAGAVMFNDAVTLAGPSAITANTVTFERTFAAGAFDATLAANSIDFNFGANSVTGAGNLTLMPRTDGVSMGIAGGAGTLQVTNAQLDAIAEGFNSLTLGRATGSALTTVNSVTFDDPVIIRQGGAGGGVRVAGPIAGIGNASVSIIAGSGGIALDQNIATTNQLIALNGPVTLGGDRVLSAGTGSIVFSGAVDGPFALTANSSGTTTFGGAVGGDAALASLTTDAGGGTTISGGAITTTGAQTYNDAVALASAATLTSTGAGAISFGTLVNGAHALAVNTAGRTTFGGVVGGLVPLASLVTDAPGSTALNATGVSTTGNQTFGDALTLGANATLVSSGGSIAFGSTIDADLASNNRTLAVTAPTGSVTFSGSVGTAQPLADLDVVAGPNTIIFNAATGQTINVSAGGSNTLTFSGPVLLNQSVTFNTDGSSDNSIVFNSGIDSDGSGVRTLNVIAGTGNVTFGAVGGAGALGGLAVSANRVTLNGDIALNGGGSFNFTNVLAVLLAPNVLIVVDAPGGSSDAGAIRFNPAGRIDTAGAHSTLTLNPLADGGGSDALITLGTIGPNVTVIILRRPFDNPLRSLVNQREWTAEDVDGDAGQGQRAAWGTGAAAPPEQCDPPNPRPLLCE